MTTEESSVAQRVRFIDPSVHRITQHRSVREFLSSSEVPPGFNVINEGGLPIDIQVNDRGFSTTLVSLHGAVTPEYRLPYLAGLGVTRDVAVNRIAISDPSLMLDPKLNLAWFAGSSRQRLQQLLPLILRRILADRPDVTRIVFFGSSGGGFASLYYASRFPGSVALVANPQTSLGKYFDAAVAKYVTCAFGSDARHGTPILGLPADIVDDLVDVYSRPVDSTVLYAQNATDTFHLSGHVRPFFERLHPSNRVLWYSSDAWGTGHVAPPKEFFVRMLHAVASADVIASALELGFRRARSTADLGLSSS